MSEHDTCSAEEYVNGDNNVAVCVDLDDQKWEENFMDNLVQEEIADTTEEESDVDEEFYIYPSLLPKLRATERQYNH